MKSIAQLLLLLPALCCVSSSRAQSLPPTGHMERSRLSWLDSLGNSKTGKPVALRGIFKTVDGKSIDFSNLQHPTFICFGFYGCHPCMHELPVFIECAGLNADIDFVYITPDTEPIRQREFEEAGLKDFKPGSNYYIIHMTSNESSKRGLTIGYPTKYFIGKNSLVQYVKYGGDPSEPLAAIKDRISKIISGG